MISVSESVFKDDILEVLTFPFGKFYLFRNFIVSEVNEDVVFSSKQAQLVLDASLEFYEKLGDLSKKVYIANRINAYSVKPLGWLKFTFLTERLYGYAVVTNTSGGFTNAILESTFVPVEFKSFTELVDAIQWVAIVNEAGKFINNDTNN
ncbi:hypothetical protein [Nonlabens ponticola]|uniref:STAS/SEC14 domain-containing protein n=1 Tax=Nonlabens ponticola TaxID=2496866 RepID=A0A3S9MW68_9FLAO|nr:hypothetical protein [Nonlabens ponticola]AZQ43384.1 hypothetical protein EJ995_03710 [Nonlabens ponticola]